MSAKRKGPRPRHIPVRTCVACRQPLAKRDLIRIVRDATGRVYLDASGKRPGRGAYLCAIFECWEQALRGASLDRALKTTIGPEDKEVLWNFARTLPRRGKTEMREAGETAPIRQGGDS